MYWIADSFSTLGLYNESMEYYEKILTIKEPIGDLRKYVEIELANVYYHLKKYNGAVDLLLHHTTTNSTIDISKAKINERQLIEFGLHLTGTCFYHQHRIITTIRAHSDGDESEILFCMFKKK